MGVLDDGERVLAPDAVTWRAWLEANHATSKGAWLVRARPGSDLEVVAYEDATRAARIAKIVTDAEAGKRPG